MPPLSLGFLKGVLALIAFGLYFPVGSSAQDRNSTLLSSSCSPQEFHMFHCETSEENELDLCFTHENNMFLIQKLKRQAAVREKILSVQEAVQSTSAKSSKFALRLLLDGKIKTIIGYFAAFDEPPVAILTDGLNTAEYCRSEGTQWNQGMFAVNGTNRFVRVQNLIRLGLAKNFDNPPDYPVQQP